MDKAIIEELAERVGKDWAEFHCIPRDLVSAALTAAVREAYEEAAKEARRRGDAAGSWEVMMELKAFSDAIRKLKEGL